MANYHLSRIFQHKKVYLLHFIEIQFRLKMENRTCLSLVFNYTKSAYWIEKKYNNLIELGKNSANYYSLKVLLNCSE